MTDLIVPDTLACLSDLYEGDVRGFARHLVDDHGVPADYLTPYANAVDAGSWQAVHRMHSGIMRGHYVPLHRRPAAPDTAPLVPPSSTPKHRRDS